MYIATFISVREEARQSIAVVNYTKGGDGAFEFVIGGRECGLCKEKKARSSTG